MRNLLTTPLPENEIAAILATTAGRTSLPLLGDPAWSAVRDNRAVTAWLNPLIARADAEAAEPLPALTDELYADFFKTGDRLPFERPYFERRRRLGRAAMAVLLGDDATRARLLPSFLKKLGELMDEESWSLPAHVWTEPTGKNPWMIDLFAAETANNLADLLVVFAALIPAALAQRIKTRLHVQIFENYITPRASFTWFNITNNWNAVCHQGVLGAALAIEEDHALVARMLSLAATRLPAFLGGYGSDGSTSEGPGYWSYGFGWFAELNAQLEHRTRGQLSVFAGDAKVAAIARFAPQVTLAEGHFVNFSDGGRTGRLSPSLLTYLGQRLADPVLIAQGTALYRHQADTGLDLDILRNDFFYFTRLALRAPAPAQLAAAREPVHADVFFDDYGAIVTRGTDARGHLWEFAAKGGHNAEHHNHNDCGSFLLNIDGAPALIEIGAPEYTRAFFSGQRYDFLAARSLGHSVPFINGREQPEGAAFAATILKTEIGGDRVEFSVDLTKCYPPEARCVSLIRTWVFQKSAGLLTITDTYQLAAPGVIESLLICPPSVTLDGTGALLATPKSTLRITPAAGTTLTTLETCDYRGHHGTDEKIQRLRFAPAAANTSAGSLAYSVSIK
ncbi:MAG: heparinase II/III family protein [Rariglobus sp.]|nr:heparinase II/III family protein [Rariglobus sp.]